MNITLCAIIEQISQRSFTERRQIVPLEIQTIQESRQRTTTGPEPRSQINDSGNSQDDQDNHNIRQKGKIETNTQA